MASTSSQTRRRDQDAQSSPSRQPRPRKSDTVKAEVWYVHSAQPAGTRGYILNEWFRPTKAQTASRKHARIAHAGYWIREDAHTATQDGINPEQNEASEEGDDTPGRVDG
ncbi:hypothetical protein AMS68_002577 [Peltaster fructicola]|uniref:Uncharacterized protein n=1 Tax=Peltaster fructicola TaxID=286661 RepID=A0A6H0XRG6_9PEZI|nr:hypothetical protein AMS68_002577 [Peltaster fructicola]